MTDVSVPLVFSSHVGLTDCYGVWLFSVFSFHLPSRPLAKNDAADRATSSDIPALYHALDGSVVLLQVRGVGLV